MAQASSTTGMLPTLDDQLAPLVALYDHGLGRLDECAAKLQHCLDQLEDGEPIEPSPAGVKRERAVPCIVCKTATFNHSGRCDRHRKRCAICGTPIAFGNWCSNRCFRDDEGDDHDEDNR